MTDATTVPREDNEDVCTHCGGQNGEHYEGDDVERRCPELMDDQYDPLEEVL